MIEVSKDWTPEERLYVVAKLGARLQGFAQKNLPQGVALQTMYDYGERLSFVSGERAEFLERNRAQILEGLE